MSNNTNTDLVEHLNSIVQFSNSYLDTEDLIYGIDKLPDEFVIEEVDFIAWLSQ